MDPHSRTAQRNTPNLAFIPFPPFRRPGQGPKPCDMAPTPSISPASAKPNLAYLVGGSSAHYGFHHNATYRRPRTTTETLQSSRVDTPLPQPERMETSLDKGRLPLPERLSGEKYPLLSGLLAAAQHRFDGSIGPGVCVQVRQLGSSGKDVPSGRGRAATLTAQLHGVYIYTDTPPKGVTVRLSAQHIHPKSSTSCLARLCSVAAYLVFATRITACGLEVGRLAQITDSAWSLPRIRQVHISSWLLASRQEDLRQDTQHHKVLRHGCVSVCLPIFALAAHPVLPDDTRTCRCTSLWLQHSDLSGNDALSGCAETLIGCASHAYGVVRLCA